MPTIEPVDNGKLVFAVFSFDEQMARKAVRGSDPAPVFIQSTRCGSDVRAEGGPGAAPGSRSDGVSTYENGNVGGRVVRRHWGCTGL